MILSLLFCIISKCFKGRSRINFNKILITGYLIIIGKILDVLFRLLSYTSIGDQECYGQIWIYSILVLLIIMGAFVAMFAKLREMRIIT